MDFNVVKEVCIEQCENMYAVGSNYLINNDNKELNDILDDLVKLEDNIRICDDINKLFNYKKMIDNIINEMEGIINA